ncbi:hypothetical protein KUV51_21705 [Tateyamaria omphalii]|uniref:hypothetical protein n=1 Tax=Tateyamaria omphalii TaxID=299262 RepID=UPI001C9A0D39|nr:hypothetical protein [Tateyamaria omphalii]MBY5935640.1 hypothetical protein [Tateyamaria omphalii]
MIPARDSLGDCDMVPLRLDLATEPQRMPQVRPVSDAAFAFLNHLRFMSMSCRSKRRADLFEACALLHATRSASQEAHAEALMRCLAQALGKQPRLHAPGTVEMSFDETWLLQLGQAITTQDEGSVAFLLKSRVLPEHRRLIRYLVGRISEYFSLI